MLLLAGKLQGEGTQKFNVVCGIQQSDTPPQNKNDIIGNPCVWVSCLFVYWRSRTLGAVDLG